MPVNEMPLINGKAYAWSSISLMIDGVIENAVTKITYSDTVDKENGYGAGQMPTDRADGNYEAKCSITLKAVASEAIAAKSPNGRIQDYGVFAVVVQYLVGTVRKTHIIHNCEFKNNGRDVSQGDKKIETEHELVVSHITWFKP